MGPGCDWPNTEWRKTKKRRRKGSWVMRLATGSFTSPIVRHQTPRDSCQGWGGQEVKGLGHVEGRQAGRLPGEEDSNSWASGPVKGPRWLQQQEAGWTTGRSLTSFGSFGPWLAIHPRAPAAETAMRGGPAPHSTCMPCPSKHSPTCRSCSCWIIFS